MLKPYFAIDIETGGLESGAALLEIGAVFDDGTKDDPKDMPSFRALIPPNQKGGNLSWQGHMNKQALLMHVKSGLLEELLTCKAKSAYLDADTLHHEFVVQCPYEAVEICFRWMRRLHSAAGCEGKIFLAGKNVAGFDIPMLTAWYGGVSIDASHRVLDVGSLFVQHSKSGWLPSLPECLEIAGIESESVTHKALDDCRATIAAIRWACGRKG